jgi:hypothetical protein
MFKEELIGTWKLVSWAVQSESGKISHPYGEQPVGQLMYDALGNMSVAIMRPDRQRFATDDKFGGATVEIIAAFEGFEAYFGTYRADEAEETVSHRVEGSLLPNLVGSTLKRFVKLSGSRLVLSTPPALYGGSKVTAVLVWERKTPGPI